MNSSRRRAPKKEIFGWAMFDFANQAYTLLIVTVIFGDLFTRVIVGDRGDDYRLGNLLWSLSLAVGYLLVVLSAPLLGAVMDLLGRRKRFLLASCLLNVAATGLLYLVVPGYIWLGVVLIVISNYAYSLGEVIIAGYLPDLGPAADYGKISGLGWALGYLGGLVATGFALVFLGEVSSENFARIRWVGPFAAAFFLLAALPTFFWLRDRVTVQQHRTFGRSARLEYTGCEAPGCLPESAALLNGYGTLNRQVSAPGERLRDRPPPAAAGTAQVVGGSVLLAAARERVATTLAGLATRPDLSLFLFSTLCAMAGIYIVVAFTFIYGAQVVGWDERIRVLTFVLVQLTAIVGALFFGWLQDRAGALRIYNFTLLIWIGAVLLIWQTPAIAAGLNGLGWSWQPQHVFLMVALVAGLCLGATQSATRAIIGLLAPPERVAEFYGFWGLVYKLAAIIGLGGVGLLQSLVGLRQAVLLCALFFVLALLAGRRVVLR